MPATGPLATVKEKFGDKAKLVAALEKLAGDDLWVARTNEAKGLAHVSNAKLLRLLATFTEVKEKFGTRAKLVDAVLEVEKRSKDAGLKQKMSEWPVPRLYDAYRAGAKRSGAGGASSKSAPKKSKGDEPAKISAKKAKTK